MNTRMNLGQVAKHAVLLFVVFLIFFPPYVLVVNSFKGKEEFNYTSTLALPESFFNFENFIHVLERGHILLAFQNTATIIILSLLGNVLLGTMVAYILGRFTFRLRSAVLGAYILASFIPVVTTQVATFSVIRDLGLFNSIYGPIILYLGADVIQIFIYLQFIKSIPYELDESAMLEGASLFRIYRSIIFPLLTPATATLVILKTINIYNDMYIPYLYMPSQDLAVVSTVLMRFFGENTSQWQYISAAILTIMIPMVIIYLLLQRYIFAGIISGSVK